MELAPLDVQFVGGRRRADADVSRIGVRDIAAVSIPLLGQRRLRIASQKDQRKPDGCAQPNPLIRFL